MGPKRRAIAVLVFLFGGIYLFFEVLADIGGVLWMHHWIADEELEGIEFRTGRADPFLRDGTIYGVTWTHEALKEPVYRERIIVRRTSPLRFNIKKLQWEFRDKDIEIKLKEEGGVVNVADAFVSIRKDTGYKEARLKDIVGTADPLAEPLKVDMIYGEIETKNNPPLSTKFAIEGLKFPAITKGTSEIEIDGIEIGRAYEELEKLGYSYEQIEFNLKLSTTYDKESHIYHLEEFLIELPSLFRISADIAFKDISRLIREFNSTGVGKAMPVAKIVSAHIEVEDFGLMPRVMKRLAEEKEMEVSKLVEEIVEDLPIGEERQSTLRTFLLGTGGKLTIKVTPKTPKKLLDMFLYVKPLGENLAKEEELARILEVLKRLKFEVIYTEAEQGE